MDLELSEIEQEILVAKSFDPVKSNYTKQETGRKMAEIVRNFYVGNMRDITVGLTADGEVDYEFDAHGFPLNVTFYSTAGGWSWSDGSPEDGRWWTDEVINGFGTYLTDCAPPTDEDGYPIDIEYRA